MVVMFGLGPDRPHGRMYKTIGLWGDDDDKMITVHKWRLRERKQMHATRCGNEEHP